MTNGSIVSGRIIDGDSKDGIGEALIIVLRPGVSTAEFISKQERSMALTSARTDPDGRFRLSDALPAGRYSLIVVARGYVDEVLEEGLRVAANAGSETKLIPIRLDRE